MVAENLQMVPPTTTTYIELLRDNKIRKNKIEAECKDIDLPDYVKQNPTKWEYF